MVKPTIDILMATHNGERFVREQIESIQAQTYEDWHLLVSDDCSTDSTLVIVSEIAKFDSRIAIVSKDVRYGSAKANFMHLLDLSEAPYAMFCDQDDIWLPRKIEKSLARIERMQTSYGAAVPLAVFCDMKVVGENLNVLHESFERSSNYDPQRVSFKHLLAQNIAAGCCMIVNSATVSLCRHVEDTENIDMHDWWAMLVVSAFGAVSYIKEPLSLYRQHDSNEVGANEYSPVARAKNQTLMMDCYLSTVSQAEEFGRIYSAELKPEDVRAIEKYVAASKARTFWRGIALLFRSGCWKRGARKFGQIAMIRKCVMKNKRGVL